MYLLNLNKENIALSISEAVRILKPKKYHLIDDFLIIEGLPILKELRLKRSSFGLIKSINRIISISKELDDVKIAISKIDFRKYYKKDFKVECSGFGKESLEKTKFFASLIIRNLKNRGVNPIVNVKEPNTLFSIIKSKTKYFIIQTIWQNQDDAKERENKELPEKMPTTLSPKLAKAMINLSGLRKGKLIDPFCGAGGILIEAARYGFKVTGYDIDKRAIGKAKLNLLHLGINKVHLERRDALTINKKYDCIITDLPFGKNSKISMELEKLYKKFFDVALKHSKKIVVGMPSTTSKSIINKKWKIVDFFELYIHKSMSKVIYVLERK
jgi:tRNA (guanine10-N2)-dimethyltransferase